MLIIIIMIIKIIFKTILVKIMIIFKKIIVNNSKFLKKQKIMYLLIKITVLCKVIL